MIKELLELSFKELLSLHWNIGWALFLKAWPLTIGLIVGIIIVWLGGCLKGE